MALFQRWVVQWVQVCKDGLRDGDCRDGSCDDSVSKGRGCAVELVAKDLRSSSASSLHSTLQLSVKLMN
ncbi:hypothetical protein L3X38_032401 [Prunus dulcis]|uniref:Uncharacterized protein n=1 Tax=Prunus dulcis TaxID=3755 RepID=A0AAD4VFE0_PRUDU|nr:hypothetical protein L3X38_032401 [Prunus dulcis]